MANFTDKTPVKRLLEIVQLERHDIYLLVILTFGYGLLGIATPVAVQTLVNIVTMGSVLQPLYVVALILFFLLVLSGVLYLFEAYVVELIQRRLFVRTALQVGERAQGVQMQVYDSTNPVELMNRFFDVSTLQKSVATLLTVGLAALLQGLVGSIILMFYSLYFMVIVLMVVIMLALIIFVLGKHAVPTAIAESKAKYETAAWLETIARNAYLFKFFNASHRVSMKTDAYAQTYLETRITHFKVLLLQNIGGVALYAFVGTAMLVLGGALVIQGQINLGQFVAAELIIFGVLAAFVRFISKLEYYYDMLAALDKIGVLQDLPQESVGDHIPAHGHYLKVVVQDVDFAYSDRIAPIQALSFSISKGRSMAILGASGSGKTTLIGLLTGLRSPKRGHISADGVDLRQLNLGHYRNRVGLVTKAEFVEGTILENLRLARDEITLEKIHQVLASLGLDNDIAKLEQGLDTPLTAFGAPLSSTQAQRMMLARAIIGEPDILMIDGQLDALSHDELMSVLGLLKENTHNWILIVTTRIPEIAQRFDSVISLEQAQEVVA